MSLKPFGFSEPDSGTRLNTNQLTTLEKSLVILFTIEAIFHYLIPGIFSGMDLNEFRYFWIVGVFALLTELWVASAIKPSKWKLLAIVFVLFKLGYLIFSYLKTIDNG